MNPEDLQACAQALNESGEPYAMVTVVRITPPTSAFVGAQAIVRADGSLQGTIGGGCAREVVVQAAVQAMQSGVAKLVLISNASREAPGVERHAMRCASNGEIELFVHPHTPAPLLLVLGHTPCAQHARSFAVECGLRVTDRVQGPEAAHIQLALVATQGDGDEEALYAALASPAREVLLVASRRKADRLRDAMRLRGVAEARLAALQAPAGPEIGAHSPAHIALAAVAGTIAALHRAPARPQARRSEPAASYINPVCGIAVDPEKALHVLRHAGQSFYFCCEGCKLEFERDPDRYAAIQAAQATAAAAWRAVQ
jgi:xanthine dehydrogenase accessory factor